MKSIVLLAFLVLCVSGHSQVRFSQRLDTTIVFSNPYLSDSGISLANLDGIDNELDPYACDSLLLSAAVFCAINELRAKKNRKTLNYDSKLESIAWNYASARGRYNFRSPAKGAYRFGRDIRRMQPFFDTEQDIWHALFGSFNALDYDRRKPFFRDKEESTTHQMVYGEFRDKLDSNYVSEPLDLTTYRKLAVQIAESCIKGRNRKEMLSKNQNGMAVYTTVDFNTLNRNIMPKINVLVVLGAYRFG